MIKTACISPFQNESEIVTLSGTFSIENRLDRVQIYGQIDITRDKQGLEYAFALKHQIDTIVEQLKREDLPESITIENAAKVVKNPFE